MHLFVHSFHIKNGLPIKIFMNDILKIQKQRVVLSILYAIFALSLHFTLIYLGYNPTASFFVAYILALFVTRSAHTIYGLKTGLFEPLK